MKQIKLLGVLAIVLSLGLAGCGSSSKSGGSSSSRHEHTFDLTKWEHDDDYHWHPATCEHTTQKGDKKQHSFGDPYDVTPATCEEAGSQKVKCSVCDAVVTQVIPAKGHTFLPEEQDVWTTVTEPTCTEVGSKTHVCQVCQKAVAEEIPATGHTYAKVKDAEGNDTEEDVVVWSVEATCEHEGKGEKECIVCHEKAEVTSEKLDHDFVPGDDSVPAPGETVFHEFTCKNGCGRKYLGFKANEVTEASKSHLVIGADGGARFWGRPIGNAIALDSDGTSVNQQNYECVYSTAETGDFFEYKFTLDEETAAQLANCRCYADAKPANYLGGQDFWACDENADEWTPGFYIDGADDHVEKDENGNAVMVKDHALPVRGEDGSEAEGVELETEVKMGKRISNYRYILYVDGEVCAFDPEIKAPVPSSGGMGGSTTRAEFVMPYTFHFTAGQHTISLRMAGGYRSTFYNFFFRAVEDEPAEAPAANPGE